MTDALQPADDSRPAVSLALPYAKLARHITAMYEIVRLAPGYDPDAPGNPSFGLNRRGLNRRDRSEITRHLRECIEMIDTLEKWMVNPVCIAGTTGDVGSPSDPGPPGFFSAAYDRDAALVEEINRLGHYPRRTPSQ